MHLIDWNTEHAAKLWAEGLSTGRIAEQIGVTKSMVCGYAGRNRDQFPLRGSPVKRSGAPKRPYKDRKAKPKTDSVRSEGAIGLLRAQIASLPRLRVIAPAIKPPPPIFVNTRRTCLFRCGTTLNAPRTFTATRQRTARIAPSTMSYASHPGNGEKRRDN